MLIVHIVILVLDQTVVSISEVGECLVHLFTIVQVLGLVNFEAVMLRCFGNWKMVAGTVLGGQMLWSGLFFLTSYPSRELTCPPDKAYLKMIFLFPRWDTLVSWRVLLVNFFPFKMHDSQSSEVRRSLWNWWYRIEQLMRPVFLLILEPCGDVYILASVWTPILSCHGSLFFHGTRETKTTWCSLSLVKKVGRADGYLHLHLLRFFFKSHSFGLLAPQAAHTQATKNSLLRCAQCSMKFSHEWILKPNIPPLKVWKCTVPDFMTFLSSLHVCLSPRCHPPKK